MPGRISFGQARDFPLGPSLLCLPSPGPSPTCSLLPREGGAGAGGEREDTEQRLDVQVQTGAEGDADFSLCGFDLIFNYIPRLLFRQNDFII